MWTLKAYDEAMAKQRSEHALEVLTAIAETKAKAQVFLEDHSDEPSADLDAVKYAIRTFGEW